MDSSNALLTLIGDLYSQVAVLRAENQQLHEDIQLLMEQERQSSVGGNDILETEVSYNG